MQINKHTVKEKMFEGNLEVALQMLTVLIHRYGNHLNEKVIHLSAALASNQCLKERGLSEIQFEISKLLFEITNSWEIDTVTLYAKSTVKDKILFLASNPKNTIHLRLDEEVRKIEEGLKRSKKREDFTLIKKFALQAIDLRRVLLDENPSYIHFSGHGTGHGGIVLENTQGLSDEVASKTIKGLFYLFRKNIKCIFLNACYSEQQVKELFGFIPFVIGMNNKILDDAAIIFSEAFYDGIANGREIEFSFDLAINAIEHFKLSAGSTPVLLKKQNHENQ
ncbi:MAG: hypothetical protein AB8G15_08990 [Saprospiraceae bacterium]